MKLEEILKDIQINSIIDLFNKINDIIGMNEICKNNSLSLKDLFFDSWPTNNFIINWETNDYCSQDYLPKQYHNFYYGNYSNNIPTIDLLSVY